MSALDRFRAPRPAPSPARRLLGLLAMAAAGLAAGVLAKWADFSGIRLLGDVFSELPVWILLGLVIARCSGSPGRAAAHALVFFLAMFGSMVFQTYLVGAGARSLGEAIKLFWTFRVPWDWAYTAGTVPDWVAQFSFGFYSLMLTSLLLGLIVMALYKPRSWCAFCPMGTMTQGICKLRAGSASASREP